MDGIEPVWAGRPERLTTADLPRGCDMCSELVTVTDDGTVEGGAVLADDARDYVFCTPHVSQVREANPFARTVKLPAGNPPESQPPPPGSPA